MKKVIVLVGPTAVGKTSLSIKIAKRYNLDIISGDSVQVFKGLDIGSAKVTKEEMDGVKHHLIDILNPGDYYSVADFQKNVRELIEKNDVSFIVGGTGLYIKAALYDYNFSGEKRDFDLEKKYENYSNEELYEVLKKVDLEASKNIHMNNRKRVIRAIELNGNKSKENNKDIPLYDSLIICLDLPREVLYERINKRVDLMIKEGLLEEVKGLYDKNIRIHAIGYSELYDYFDGLISLDEAIELIKKNSRHYAKRQMTWFRNQMNAKFFSPFDEDKIFKEIEEFLWEYI